MKIASALSGLLVVVLLILFLTGTIAFDNVVYESILKGNRLFAANNHEQALDTYNAGLSKNAENPKLNYNSGQASYLLNKFEDASKYYAKAFETPDKYINSGNSNLKLANAAGDDAQKQQYLLQALETFKQGIIAFPENIPLKYNYEYVKNMLGDQQNNNEQNQENKENQEQNNQDENSEQNEQDKASQQNENSGQEDNQEQNQEKSENQQAEQAEQNNEQKDAQTGDQNEENNSDKNVQQAEQSDSSQSEQTDSQIANVLRMLEKQEEESLKNNQEVKRSTKGDEYDW
ncbi:MAG: 50S ribosomal protein L22 [Firmicutes bacterium ADurb.Bin419]|nr:MAG: 50S ribosomal protein L22 [Firmicutes bacterium ADurb.Bin419]